MMVNPWIELRNGVEYSYRLRDNEARSCKVVCASISGIGSEEYLEFPCFHCCSTSFYNDYGIYINHCALEFSKSLYLCNLNNTDNLPLHFARMVGREFAGILRRANDNHRCPPLYLNAGYILDIKFRRSSDDAFFTRVLLESFNDDSGSTTKPASVSYVSGLIKLRDEKLIDDSVWKSTEDHECSICLDVIDTHSSSLSLECSHFFHQSCVLKWLADNSVCPLCRFQMPTQP